MNQKPPEPLPWTHRITSFCSFSILTLTMGCISAYQLPHWVVVAYGILFGTIAICGVIVFLEP